MKAFAHVLLNISSSSATMHKIHCKSANRYYWNDETSFWKARVFSSNLLNCKEALALFQNIFKFCTFLPNFSNILPFFNIFFALFLKNRTQALNAMNHSRGNRFEINLKHTEYFLKELFSIAGIVPNYFSWNLYVYPKPLLTAFL